MYAHPKFIKRNPVKTQLDDMDFRMFAAMAEYSGLSSAELARILIQEGIKRRVKETTAHGDSAHVA